MRRGSGSRSAKGPGARPAQPPAVPLLEGARSRTCSALAAPLDLPRPRSLESAQGPKARLQLAQQF